MSVPRYVPVPGPPHERDAPPEEVEAFRTAQLRLTTAAGLGGLPQVTLPAVRREDGVIFALLRAVFAGHVFSCFINISLWQKKKKKRFYHFVGIR